MADIECNESTGTPLYRSVWSEHKRVYAAAGIIALAAERMQDTPHDDITGALEGALALLQESSNKMGELASDLLHRGGVSHERKT